MSLFDRIPAEVTAHLFVIAAGFDSALPTTVCLVCRQWRSIAMEAPDLWSRIVFDPTSYNADSSCSFSKQAEWLKRSQSALLTIEFRDLQGFQGYGMREVQQNVNQRLMGLITPHAHRWKILETTSSDLSGIDWELLAALDRLQTPSLHTIFLSDEARPRFFSGATPRFGSVFRPKLRSLSIPSLTFTSSSLQLTPHLEYLSMGSHTWNWSKDSESETAQKILAVLRVAKNLQRLEVLIYTMLWDGDKLDDIDQNGSHPERFSSGLEELHLSRRLPGRGPWQKDRSQNPCFHRTFKNLPSLRIIKFTRLSFRGDSQLRALGENCPDLAELRLTECVLTGEEILNEIVLLRHAIGWAPLQLLEVIWCRTVHVISGFKLRQSHAEGFIQHFHIENSPEV